jgi:acyl carrier protein
MGMEGVELILSMEEVFEISISDEEAYAMNTPKDAINLISKKVQISKNSVCLNQVAFHKIRKILVNDFNISRKEIKTNNNLRKLISPKLHRKFWEKLKEMVGDKKLAQLSWPTWISVLLFGLFTGFTIYIGISIGWFIGIVAGISIYVSLSILAKPLRSQIPTSYYTIELLIRHLVTIAPDTFKRDQTWSLSQIREEVKNIVMEVLGTDDYKEEWEFVRDFGIG